MELVTFWKEFNPEVYAMVEAAKFKTGDRCGPTKHQALPVCSKMFLSTLQSLVSSPMCKNTVCGIGAIHASIVAPAVGVSCSPPDVSYSWAATLCGGFLGCMV